MNLPSTALSLNVKDFLRGLILAILAPVLLAIQQSIAAGEVTLNWRTLGLTAISALVAYLIKNFFTNSVGQAENTLQDAQQKVIDKQNK